MTRMWSALAGVVTAVMLAVAPAQAEDSPAQRTGGPVLTFGAGAGMAQQYEGADEYRPVPFVVARARWGGRYFVGTAGEGLRADISGVRAVEVGPALATRFGRDRDVDDPVIARMTEVDRSIEVGGYLAFNLPFPFSRIRKDALTVEATVLKDIAAGHGGHSFRTELKYRGLVTSRTSLQFGPFATYASEKFMSAYYDVTPRDAARTGLRRFDADAGWKDYGMAFNGRYMIYDGWNINGTLSYRRYVNDAADSPVVRDRGAPGAWFGGFALAYSF